MNSTFSSLLPGDYRDMVEFLLDEGADFLIVGGWAVSAHGHVRATKDLDLFVRPSPDNAPRVLRALMRFGAPLHDLSIDDLSEPGIIFQVGGMMRIDITTTIDGVDFDQASVDRVGVSFGERTAWVIGREALLANKRAAGRPSDQQDVAALEKLTDRAGR